MRFGEFLIQKKLVTKNQIDEAVEVGELTKIKLGRVLMQLDYLTQTKLNNSLSEFLNIKKVDSVNKIIREFSGEMVKKHLYGSSIAIEGGTNTLLLSGGFNDEVIDHLEKTRKKEVEFLLLSKDQWVVLVKAFFGESKSHVIRSVVNEDEFAYRKMFSEILKKAKEKNASDVHFESTESGLRVRYRIIGDLKTIRIIPKKHSEAFLTEAKELSGLPLVITGKPADGEAKFLDFGLKVRSSKLPGHIGDGLCLRINNFEDTKLLNLESMGLQEADISTFRKALSYRNGVILISGQTGSGKSSTVFSMIMEMDRDKKKIITLEDPIEYECENVLQLKINAEKMSFNEGLRSILRHDPDVIVVGEIRDEETAQICFKAAATGHLVISTIHTNDALGVISRLQMLGITDDIIKENLRLSVAQRLIKRLCQNCSIESTEVIENKKEMVREVNHKGCSDVSCVNGYENRRQIVLQTVDEDQISHFLSTGSRKGVKKLQEVAVDYVKKGILSYGDACGVA